MNYVVVENTPGYLPEDDDPSVFDQYQEALNYLVERRKEVMEWAWEIAQDSEYDVKIEVSEIEDGGFSFSDTNNKHDLGRVVEILPFHLRPTRYESR